MPPTPANNMRTLISSVEILLSAVTIASTEPCTSPLITTGYSIARVADRLSNRFSRFGVTCAVRTLVDCSLRYKATSRARASFSTTVRTSPADGTPVRPSTSTGVAGPASATCCPFSLTKARTFPLCAPTTNMSPRFSVPRFTSTVATAPRPLSSCASTTTASAARSGLAFSSMTSACKASFSSKVSRPVFFNAETSTS